MEREEQAKTNPPEEQIPGVQINFGFEWLANEDLLRDEGILYGLSGNDAQEKLTTIEYYYQEQAAVLVAKAEQISALANEQAKEIESLREKVNKAKGELEEWEKEKRFQPHHFWRTVASTIAYSIMVFFCFWLIFSWLGPQLEYPILITLGIYAFGSLSLFTKSSLLYQAGAYFQLEEQRERWKTILEEFIIPLVATIFILAWGYREIPIIQILALGLLLYTLFLFSGKGLLSTFVLLYREVGIVRENLHQKRFQQKRAKQKKEEIAGWEAAISRLESTVGELQAQKDTNLLHAKKLAEEAKTRKAYFLSEFALARATRNALSNEQLVQLSHYRKNR